ncbi:MAG TPA: A/G-specific adenine glycosylase [Chitinophagaceae bacterium]|nr:A/G-specific adenine glycosylase [Chitinophagaceae bacterium]
MKKLTPAIPKTAFSRLLLKWNRKQNTRQMPWKGEKDPYLIWLSEIILQQTRVEHGLNYYNKFVKAFPDVHKLAKAPGEKVFKLWEGLGYYTRCRNLIASAKYISKELKGKFPGTYETIKALKGVGPYTAAAISSFAFNESHAVVDGNVFRVLARVFGISKAIDSTRGKKHFTALAQELLDKKQPGLYNQAIMDFGAIICKPATPLCSNCIFNKTCYAFLNDKINVLPVKEKKLTIKNRWFFYLILEYRNTIALRERTSKDIWQGLFEFPLLEMKKDEPVNILLKKAEINNLLPKHGYKLLEVSPLYKQQLSHQLLAGRFLRISVSKKHALGDWKWIEKNKLARYPLPKFINQHLME